MSANLGQNIGGEGVGDDKMNPTPNKILSWREVLAPFPVILLKLATPLVPSHPKQSWILPKVGGNEWVFFYPNIAGESWGRGRRDEPKAEQKMVIRSRLLPNNYLEGLFHTAPSSFVFHCSSHILEAL